MNPIFEQGDGRGIGHGLDSFLRRFDEIILNHSSQGKALAFAIILYNFEDEDLRAILKDHGVFTQLDRLSGSDLSVFYLHSAGEGVVEKFNKAFLPMFDNENNATPPCVIFFKLKNERIEDVAIAQLEQTNTIHGFQELYSVIDHYIENDIHVPVRPDSPDQTAYVLAVLRESLP